MTTNVSLITDSLRLLGVIAEGETPDANQGSQGLARLNRMMEAWTEIDIDLGWFEQSSTTGTAPVPKWAERGIISKLAQDLQAFYPSSSLVPWVMDDQMNGFGIIQRKGLVEHLKTADMTHMPMGEGRFRRGVSILTDD